MRDWTEVFPLIRALGEPKTREEIIVANRLVDEYNISISLEGEGYEQLDRF